MKFPTWGIPWHSLAPMNGWIGLQARASFLKIEVFMEKKILAAEAIRKISGRVVQWVPVADHT